jgi:hypothetical protein
MRAYQINGELIYEGCNDLHAPDIDWLHDFALRIIVPKATLQANRGLLIFKSYAEVMGLPYEILPNEVHFYCNEILDDDKPTIEHFNLTVEER